mmetsp:Transcript_73705/g.130118  ORF Transcript_73705/g.130118 Transcript_73705/m.130118 type:complete len:245 (-) Transcript_73705:119-853(-)
MLALPLKPSSSLAEVLEDRLLLLFWRWNFLDHQDLLILLLFDVLLATNLFIFTSIILVQHVGVNALGHHAQENVRAFTRWHKITTPNLQLLVEDVLACEHCTEPRCQCTVQCHLGVCNQTALSDHISYLIPLLVFRLRIRKLNPPGCFQAPLVYPKEEHRAFKPGDLLLLKPSCCSHTILRCVQDKFCAAQEASISEETSLESFWDSADYYIINAMNTVLTFTRLHKARVLNWPVSQETQDQCL